MRKHLLLIFFLTISVSSFSQNAPLRAPLNPDFITFMAKYSAAEALNPGSDEYNSVSIPPPGIVNFDSYLSTNKLKSTTFASVYDMRTLGLMTPVKGQTASACWAFATMASVESRWLKLGLATFDLSDNNLKYCHGFDPSRNSWGNHWMSTAYFARRSGPLTEADDPNSTGSSCPTGKIPLAYLTDSRYLPNDINTIKQALLDQGAIYTMMLYSDTYFNAASNTYFYNGTPEVNHAVDLAGWDDTKVTAGGTGAWICKNSYGAGWGEGGYFYVSYNDNSILDYNAYWPSRYAYEANAQVYGYDYLGNYTSYGFTNSNIGYMLVKYTATGKQLLSKIGTYAMAADASIEIDIFDNFDTGTKTLSGLLTHQAGLSCAMPGYYTFDLSQPVVIDQNNDFYVRVRYQTPLYNWPIPVEIYIDKYSIPVIESNVCWISSTGSNSTWELLGNNVPGDEADPCVKVYAEPLISWTGNTDNNWNTPGNWSSNAVPTTMQNVNIPAVVRDPVVNQDPGIPSVCNHLTIQPGAVLTIAAGKALTVTKTLTNLAGTNGLVIQSGGSLIGDINAEASVESAISNNNWHLVSSPVSNATASAFTGKYLQKHTESNNTYTDIIPSGEALTPAKGYALWGDAGFTSTYTGTLNTGAKSISVSRSNGETVDRGWNLVGNPYPSSIDWDAASGWTKTNVSDAIYIENAGEWATYISGAAVNGGSHYIAPGQGFFVSATNLGAGTLAMNNNVRVHNATPFFKNTNAGSFVRMEVSGNGYSDEAIVRFMTEATNEFDSQYDAQKLYGYTDASAQIYTLGSTPMTINSLLPETEKVPLGIQAKTAGNYTLAATETDNLPYLTLEDTKTGIYTDIKVKPYSFAIEPGESEQRFILHFNAPSEIQTENTDAAVYGYGKIIYINIKDKVIGDIFVYTIAGQLVAGRSSASGINEIGMPTAGIYIVKVISRESTVVTKVVVR